MRVRPVLWMAALCMTSCSCSNSSTTSTKSFTGFNSDLPFPGFVVAEQKNRYHYLLEAPRAVKEDTEIGVHDDTLILGIKPGKTIQTDNGTYTIWAPEGSVSRISSAGAGSLSINGSIVPRSKPFKLSASGANHIDVHTLNVTKAEVTQNGASVVNLKGEVGNVDLAANGATLTYVSHVNKTIHVVGTGSGRLYVDSLAEDLQISGAVSGSYQVVYNKGRCSVKTTTHLHKACVKQDQLSEDFVILEALLTT